MKQKLFIRNSHYTYIDKKEATLKESTIPEFDQPFLDSLLNAMPGQNSEHSEVLGEFYGKIDSENLNTKLHVIKASRLYDKNNQMSIESMTEKLQGIIRAHIKRDSYFKVKSGLIGTRAEIDSSLFGDDRTDEAKIMIEERRKEKERKERFLQHKKKTLTRQLHNNFISKKTDLNFIHKKRKYEFQLENITTLHDYVVYKISFKPKGSADYNGTLYVNADDFAVIKVDYENVKPLRKFSLFGISYSEYIRKGTLIYEKNGRDKYAPRYMEEKLGHKMGVKRPVKIIEKNKYVKGRHKQNEVGGDIHFILRSTEKSEMVIFESNAINESDFDRYEEKPDVVPQYLSEYDPSFWEGYNIIEPNAAIKEFKSTGKL